MLITELIRVIRLSTMIQSESEEEKIKVPALLMTDEDMLSLIKLTALSIPVRNVEITMDGDLPDNLAYLVLLLVKKEIYLRLATGDARNYPLTAEGASLRKDYIFRHYMELVRTVIGDYADAKSSYDMNKPINVSTLSTYRRHLDFKQYMASKEPNAHFELSLTPNTLVVKWSKLQANDGYFWRYDVFIKPYTDKPLYDVNNKVINAQADYSFYDPRRNSLEVPIEAGRYRVMLAVYLTNGVRGVHETEFTVEGG